MWWASVLPLVAAMLVVPGLHAELASDPASASKKPAVTASPDVLVFSNGDTLSGKFVRAVSGTVSFHSDELGDINVTWDKVRELRSSQQFVVLESTPGVRRSKLAHVETGSIHVRGGTISVIPVTSATPGASEAGRPAPSSGTPVTPASSIATSTPTSPPVNVATGAKPDGSGSNQQPAPVAGSFNVPVKNAQYVLDRATYDKQLREEPSILAGWNGSATAGVTIVEGTERQYTYTSAITLVRTVPTVTWLNPRNRSTVDFSSGYGKITEPGYTSAGVYTPPAVTETSIFHADAERDQYVATRFYALGQTAFDHNYAQGLDLQQIYGAGFGWTTIKRPKQQLDLKATLQYEKQQFISSASGTNQNLVGSTLAATYVLKLPHNVVFNQQVAYVPAFNVARAYSGNETNTLVLPVYKNFSFTLGTIDSYLNDPPPSEPPTTRNSFQFTTGVTYVIKSKY